MIHRDLTSYYSPAEIALLNKIITELIDAPFGEIYELSNHEKSVLSKGILSSKFDLDGEHCPLLRLEDGDIQSKVRLTESSRYLLESRGTLLRIEDGVITSSDRQCVLNRIETPDGTILTSHHQHDFVQHVDKNGRTYTLDGGINFPMAKTRNEGATDMLIFADEPHERVREGCHWGVLEKGTTSHKWVALKDLTSEHIANIIKGVNEGTIKMHEWRRKAFDDELAYRS